MTQITSPPAELTDDELTDEAYAAKIEAARMYMLRGFFTEWAGELRQDDEDGKQTFLNSLQEFNDAERESFERCIELDAEFRRRATRPADTRPKNITPKRTAPRARSHRSARRSTGSSTGGQDPGDPDPDPVQAKIDQLVSEAPKFSAGQRQLLARLLGGGQR